MRRALRERYKAILDVFISKCDEYFIINTFVAQLLI